MIKAWTKAWLAQCTVSKIPKVVQIKKKAQNRITHPKLISSQLVCCSNMYYGERDIWGGDPNKLSSKPSRQKKLHQKKIITRLDKKKDPEEREHTYVCWMWFPNILVGSLGSFFKELIESLLYTVLGRREQASSLSLSLLRRVERLFCTYITSVFPLIQYNNWMD